MHTTTSLSGIAVAVGMLLSACADTVSTDTQRIENRGAGKDNWWDALPRAEWAAYERVSIESEWFEVYRVADGVHAIYEPGQFEEVISFLIEGDERALLFDTGLGIGDIRAVVDALTERPVVVLNSHTHYDHVGGNHRFDHVLGADTPYSRAHEEGGSHDDVAEFIGPGWVWKPFPSAFEPAAYRSRPYRVTDRVADGDVIELGGRRLEVLETPGHAPDALCLLDRDQRLLFTGDTFYLASLYTHLEGSDFDRYRQSSARLAALEAHVDWLMTAHNVPRVPSRYLGRLAAAFDDIASNRAEARGEDGHREYDFGEFSVIVADRDFE